MLKLVAILIGVCCLAVASGTEQPCFARGILAIGDSAYASLSTRDHSTSASGWLKVGDRWNAYTVVGISAGREEVYLKHDSGESVTLSLAEATIASIAGHNQNDKGELIPLDLLDWEWIHSDANEMRDKIVELPMEIALSWKEMSEIEQIGVRNYYRTRGVDLTVEFKGNLVHVSHPRLRDPKRPPSPAERRVPVDPIGMSRRSDLP